MRRRQNAEHHSPREKNANFVDMVAHLTIHIDDGRRRETPGRGGRPRRGRHPHRPRDGEERRRCVCVDSILRSAYTCYTLDKCHFTFSSSRRRRDAYRIELPFFSPLLTPPHERATPAPVPLYIILHGRTHTRDHSSIPFRYSRDSERGEPYRFASVSHRPRDFSFLGATCLRRSRAAR